MKTILVSVATLLTILNSTSTLAAVAVGDMALYNLTISNGQMSRTVDQKSEVVAINATAGTFTQKLTISYNGTVVSSQDSEVNLNSATSIETTIDNCKTLETITVKAGTFQACHINTTVSGSQSDLYFAKVPFGIVKSISTTSGFNTTYELVAYTKK